MDPSLLSDPELNAICGLDRGTFDFIYNKYCINSIINSPTKLLFLFTYYKLYPVTRAWTAIYGDAAKNPGWLLSEIRKWEDYLANAMNEIQSAWDARRDEENRIPHVFPPNVVGSVDTFPILVVRPSDPTWQRYLYNGKYKHHVVKIQAISDHRGNIIWYSGPHIGVTSDINLFRTFTPPLDAGEMLLGDKAYCDASMSGVLLAPYKKRRGQAALSEGRAAYNLVHRWYRATVEHSYSFVKRFRILNTIYRGRLKTSAKYLSRAVKIIMHASTIYTTSNPRRIHTNLIPVEPAPAEPDLDEDWDVDAGTGAILSDFSVGMSVKVRWLDDWWYGTVSYTSARTGKVSVRWLGSSTRVAFAPRFVKPTA